MIKVSAVFILILILINLRGFSQNDSLQAGLVLIGDAGDFKKGKHPVTDAVKETGGRGSDTFNIKGKIKKYIYDFTKEKNCIENKSHTVNKFVNDPASK